MPNLRIFASALLMTLPAAATLAAQEPDWPSAGTETLLHLLALDPSMSVVPYLSTGATDTARLRLWGMQAFGLLPFPMNQDDEDRMHGNDERIPLASLEFGTRLIFGAVLRVAR